MSYHFNRLPKRQTNSGQQARAVALVDDPSVEVFMAAAAAFQDVHAGKRWLTMPSESFGNKPPLAEIGSEEGRKKILNELALIEHGMF